MEISELLGEEYLERFKVYHQATLFEPFWDALLLDRCPLCGSKLKKMKTKPLYYCKSIKHKRSFLIKQERLSEVKRKHKK
jgi:hypothetical protein